MYKIDHKNLLAAKPTHTHFQPQKVTSPKKTKYKFISRSKLICNARTQKQTIALSQRTTNSLDVNSVLGRRVCDVSKNRFKFISSKSSAQMKRAAVTRQRLAKNQFKLVNRVRAPVSTSFVIAKNGKTLKRLGPYPTTTTTAIGRTARKYKLNTTFKLIKSSSNTSITQNYSSRSSFRNDVANGRFKLENRPTNPKLNKILIARFSFFYSVWN